MISDKELLRELVFHTSTVNDYRTFQIINPGLHETFQTITQTRSFKQGLKSQIAVFRDLKYQTSNQNFIPRLSQAGVVQPVLRSQASI